MYVNVTVLRGNSRSEEESMHPERQIEWDASWNHSSAAQNHHNTGLKYWETINGTTFFLNLVAILCGIVWEWDPPKFFMVQNHSTGHNWRCITYILYWCVCVFHVFHQNPHDGYISYQLNPHDLWGTPFAHIKNNIYWHVSRTLP